MCPIKMSTPVQTKWTHFGVIFMKIYGYTQFNLSKLDISYQTQRKYNAANDTHDILLVFIRCSIIPCDYNQESCKKQKLKSLLLMFLLFYFCICFKIKEKLLFSIPIWLLLVFFDVLHLMSPPGLCTGEDINLGHPPVS